ncbi:MAG: histidine--tRNA ligase [Clostridia bacterium]|nr:histidine--tRNA ligase [Clostridia bacterium]
MIQKPKGTKDILPSDIGEWQFIEKTAREVCHKRGFEEIRIPTFEETQLFKRGVGDTTDVVQKEMYTFEDRDGGSLTLRPEGTAGVARAVIENGLAGDTMPLKLFYIINCFRHERPQAGRYREFYQFGVELFGASTPSADAELIALADEVLKSIGILNTELHINSIGCPNCRPAYKSALVKYFGEHTDELCDTCKNRLSTNPLRILDCKSPICSGIAASAPSTVDNLCEECKNHFESLKARLDLLGIKYTVDPHIVRGLDYYSRTVFEFISTGIGAQSTVCGGGRYDGLVEQIGGPKLPGIGFAAGINRLVLSMQNGSNYVKPDNSPALYIATMGEKASLEAVKICAALRDKGIPTETDIVGRSLKAQMKYANKISAKYVLILGDNEVESGSAQLRNMADSSQTEIKLCADSIAEIIAH